MCTPMFIATLLIIHGLLRKISFAGIEATNAGEGVEKREPSYTVGGNAN